MGKKTLELLNQAGNSLLAYSQHPVKAMDAEFQSAYLYAMAIVMDADEQINGSELDNIKRLLIAFEMPEEKLEDLIAFGKTNDEEALRDILIVLQGSESLRYVFLLDCLSLAYADSELHKEETNTIKVYSEFIKVSQAQLAIIEHLEKIVRTKDYKALYRFFLQKYDLDISIFKYLLDFYKIDIEQVKQEEKKRLTKLFDMEFSKAGLAYERFMNIHWYTFANRQGAAEDFILGRSEDTEKAEEITFALISNLPLQLSQLAMILQDKLEQQLLRVEDLWVIENESDNKIFSIGHSLMEYAHGQFSFKSNTHARGLTRSGMQLVCDWINTLTNLTVSPISMKEGFREDDPIVSIQFAFEPREYVEVHNDSHSIKIIPSYQNDGKTFKVEKINQWKTDYTDATTVFRVMKTAVASGASAKNTKANGNIRNPRTGELK